MFMAALCTRAKTCKKSKYPLRDEWIKKIWYLYKMDHHSVIRENEIMQQYGSTRDDHVK